MNKVIISSHIAGRLKILRTFPMIALLILLGACNDVYDQHYDGNTEVSSKENIWTKIEQIEELRDFAQILRNYGYDEILSKSQAYTVFAPTNEALAALDTTGMDVKKELIENHISRFFIPVSTSGRVNMLNDKRIELTTGAEGGGSSFGSAPFLMPVQSEITSNGLIHLLDGYSIFFPNIWESLDKETGLDSIRNYLYSYNDTVFMPELSTPGNIVDGQQTYLDSVYISYNQLLSSCGLINSEDSTYLMLVPDNNAWREAYERVKSDFVFYRRRADEATELQKYYTSLALVKDLFFNETEQVGVSADSLVSTQGSRFERNALLDGATKVTTSNGDMYITNHLKIKDVDSWHTPIKVEAERTYGRSNDDNASTSYVVIGDATLVSNGQYLRLVPNGATSNPNVTFEIPGTLSSTYNVYVVFLSNKMFNPNITPRPNKVYFGLQYLNAQGGYGDAWYPDSGTILTDPEIMVDTIQIFSGLELSVAGIGEDDAVVNLKVISSVSANETTEYSRELLIDCILFEPVGRE